MNDSNISSSGAGAVSISEHECVTNGSLGQNFLHNFMYMYFIDMHMHVQKNQDQSRMTHNVCTHVCMYVIAVLYCTYILCYNYAAAKSVHHLY